MMNRKTKLLQMVTRERARGDAWAGAVVDIVRAAWEAGMSTDCPSIYDWLSGIRGSLDAERKSGELEGLRLALAACEAQESKGGLGIMSEHDRDGGVDDCAKAIRTLIKAREV